MATILDYLCKTVKHHLMQAASTASAAEAKACNDDNEHNSATTTLLNYCTVNELWRWPFNTDTTLAIISLDTPTHICISLCIYTHIDM